MPTAGQADRRLLAGTMECQVARRPVSLRVNFSWTFIGNMVYSACQCGILVVLAKLGNVEMVGRFSLALAVTAPVIIFSQLQLRGVQATDATRRFPFHDYLRLRLTTTFLAVLVICGIAAASGFPPQTMAVVLLIAGAKAMDAVSDVYFGSWQQRERMDAVAKAQGISGLVALAALAALVLWTHDLTWGACGITCGSAVGLGYVVLCQGIGAGDSDLAEASPFRERRAPLDVRRLWRLAGLALPLAFAGGIASLQANFPRYCLSDMHGTAPWPSIPWPMRCWRRSRWSARHWARRSLLARALYYQEGQLPAYRRLAFQVTAAQVLVCLACCGVFLVFGEALFTLVFAKEYAAAVPALVVMSAGLTLLSLGTWGTTLFSAGRMFRTQLLLVVLTFVIQIPVTWYLVARYGVPGAAWSDFVRYVVLMALVNSYAARALGKCRSVY